MTKANIEANLEAVGTVDAILFHSDGTFKDLGRISDAHTHRLIGYPIQWWRALWHRLRLQRIIPTTLGFALFLSLYGTVDQPVQMRELFKDPRVVAIIMDNPLSEMGLVVTGGMNFLATDFASGQASPRISSMNFHDSGTGVVAATSTDSGLGTQAGPTTRATGTQSNPVTNQYRSVGTIAYTGTLAITEWGVFNQAAQGGTMWDRRVFSAVNVVNGDSIQFTYTCTLTAGGS
jgi:hypothetical protein